MRKVISAVMIALLLISTFPWAFNIQPVKATETINIRADGSVDPPTAPISNVENIYYTFTDNIYGSIVVERSNIIIDGAGHTIQGAGSGYGFYLLSFPVNNVTIKRTNIKGFDYGIFLGSPYCTIFGNNLTYNYVGIFAGPYSTILGNTITNNSAYGIYLQSASGSALKDNSMADNYYNFAVFGGEISHYIMDVDESNTVEGKPIYYLVNRRDTQIPSDAGYVALVNSTNITVKGLELKNNGQGILLAYTTNSKITGNNIRNTWLGIDVEYSSHNDLSRNNITNSGHSGILLYTSFNNYVYGNNVTESGSVGVYLMMSYNNTISGNSIKNNSNGISLYYSSLNTITMNWIINNTNQCGIGLMYSAYNRIFYNNSVNNTRNVDSPWASGNIWNSPERITYTYNGKTYTNYRGNYWSDYTGSDADGDGIGDTPYSISVDKDNYPLMEPFENYETEMLRGKIVFSSYRDGNWEIYKMNADGTNQTRLTYSNEWDKEPSWSPDGNRIAFRSGISDGGNLEIYAMNSDGSNQTSLTNNISLDCMPSWSPNGSRIAFLSTRTVYYDVYVMNTDGSNPTRLTYNNDGGTLSGPSWSPDSSKIAFNSAKDGNYETYVMNADGTNMTRLTNNTAVDGYPSWSPDGSKIAFSSNRDGNYEIYVMNADGSNQIRLTFDDSSDFDPVWSPDGNNIAFVSKRDGDNEIYVMSVDGNYLKKLTENNDADIYPDWIFVVAPPPNQSPTCVIKLQKNGVEIDEIDVGEFFDIYLGDSSEDIGIKKIRFSSDDVQDGSPTGKWTECYDWDVSSGDWNAETKIKRWAFTTPGYKEVWAEVEDDVGQTATCRANILANLPESGLVVITSPLVITPIKNIYYVGDSLNAEFSMKNIGDLPITLDVLTVGGRLNGFIPAEGAPDFTFQSVTLKPNEAYQYQESLTLTQMGNYRFFVAYHIENPTLGEKKLLDENNWNTCVELGEGLTHTDRVKNIIVFEEGTVPEEVSQLREAINRLKNYHLQYRYPPYLLGADSFKSAVATLWVDFTSFITRTDLTKKYDELHFSGIEYQWLSLQALMDADRSLESGDVEGARRYLQRSYRYGRASEMSFTAAAEVFDRSLEAGEILAKGIKDGCEAAVSVGVAIVFPPAAAKVDAIYMSLDFVVTAKVSGVDQATKDLITKLIAKWLLKELKFTSLNENTLEAYVNKVSAEVSLDMLLGNEEFMMEFGLELRKVITDRVIDEVGVWISDELIEEIVKGVIDRLESFINSVQVKAKSPVELRVLDPKGQITGLINKTVKHEIPMSLYYNGTVTVFFPADTYRYEIAGIDEGTYGLEITSVKAGTLTVFTTNDVPVTPKAIHQYTIDWDALSQGEEDVTVQIDSDGDGVFEQIIINLKINTGWNLIGFPFQEQQITDIFNEESSKIYVVYGYKESGWRYWMLGTPSTLNTFEGGHGYWVKAKEPFQLTWVGALGPASTANSGWSLIALNTLETINLSDIDTTGIQYIYGYDNQLKQYIAWIHGIADEYQQLKTIEPRKGYWIKK